MDAVIPSTVTINKSCTVAEGQHAVQLFHLLALKGALKLEALGMRRRGRSALSIAKETTNCGSNSIEAQIALIEHLIGTTRAKVTYVQEPTT